MVHHYRITADVGGDRLINKTLISDFFRHGDPADMEKKYRVDLCDLPEGEVKISVTAVNSWDKESRTLEKIFSI